MKQKDIFISGEGDKWHERNERDLLNKDLSKDLVVQEIIELIDENQYDSGLKNGMKRIRLLEVGCGEASRLTYLEKNFNNLECYGVEPSKKAIEIANSKKIKAIIGTADNLEFDDGEFDIVIYGFCLYLCDREDLFQIAKEADRVLKDTGFIVILDFFYPGSNSKNKYSHKEDIYSYKMDYRKLFNWHPFYECYKHKIVHHSKHSITDEINEWIAVSLIRKNKYFNDK
tara:strand:- start:568 stop:1251 length:684 start_codon:yes stop_codon:yes gene_type:complete